jgi:hypothetical protein
MIGLLAVFPNVHVEILTGPNWTALLTTLQSAKETMMNLLMDCAIFARSSKGIVQISGMYSYQLSTSLTR